MKRRIGILTSGGDCPGLNATIRGVAKACYQMLGTENVEIVGISDGYYGLIHNICKEMKPDDFSGILTRGGTILGTKRQPFKMMKVIGDDNIDKVKNMKKTYQSQKLDCLLTLGGNGTHKTSLLLSEEGLNVIGLPKTIDNDIYGTDVTFGFHTAVDIATDAIDRLHTTANSHSRILLCEIMGNKAGWLTLNAGIAGGADIILIPEIPYDIDKVCKSVQKRSESGKNFSIVAVAEGCFDKEEAKSALKLWWGDIKSSVGDFVNGVKLSIDETKESFISKWNTAKSKFGEIKADVGAKFDTAADKVNSWKATAVEKLKGAKAAVAGAVDNGFDWGTLKNNVVNKIGTVDSKIGGILNNEKNYWKGNKKSINSKIIRKIGTVKSKIGADPNSIKSMRQKIQDGLQGIQVSVTTTNTDGTTNQAITPNNSETAAGKQVRIIEDGKPRTVSIYLHGKWWQYRNKKGQWTNYKMAASGGVFSNNRWLPVTRYATGGLPKSAEMFMAREAGPELVGRIGSRTAVVNNDQIVASVSEGVYRAVVAALGSGGNQQAINLALRLIMDGKQTTQIVIDRINEMIDTTGQIPIRI